VVETPAPTPRLAQQQVARPIVSATHSALLTLPVVIAVAHAMTGRQIARLATAMVGAGS
jgi:di/tricarboxylate transporter